ncbi:hypothetical protein EV200_109155 [Pedobacter psychrotolerans]|uniref:Uncharacterized protein n=1 Tax=Pedobacter psychrotolerans TaxID=1843235 RepID=A0A4R2H3S7_9SPHI|nr:hypothetical protein [Pedobacter psychrotolerans]TCO19971.1 hypothetical protein EV200_109155 [Pedobacter psychrotolerans]GGE50197.1 hypothetical protein GCM10011413_15520 [Pedobacter psychrotolerans]
MKIIKPKISGITYEPKVKELCLIADLKFVYDLNIRKFHLDENPHGEPCLKEIFDIIVDEIFSNLSFKSSYRNKETIFKLESQNEIDNLVFKVISSLNLSVIDQDEMDKFQLFFEEGRFKELDIYKQNEKYELIDSLAVTGDEDEIILIKQNPWGRFKVDHLACSDQKQLDYSLTNGELGIYQLDINDAIYSLFSKFIERVKFRK